jgi:hypothetical protein
MGDLIGSWSDWVQDVGKSVITTATEAKYKTPTDQADLQLKAYGPSGEEYTEGQPNAAVGRQWIPGVPNAVVILGGAFALMWALKD